MTPGKCCICLTLVLLFGDSTYCQLNRNTSTYKSVIRGVHDYFNNTCIIILYASSTLDSPLSLEELSGLKDVQEYLSGLKIRTAVMDFETFKTRVGGSYHNLKRPLFVMLTDHDSIRDEFAFKVSRWISMAYPTWLLFFSDHRTTTQYFRNIYVPFDCMFMISLRNGTSEVIKEIYQVYRQGELREMVFGYWHPSEGITPPKRTFYQRRHTLFGHNLRITSVNDPPMSRIARDSVGKMIGINGFFGDLMKLLQESINFTVSYKEADSWGTITPNGTWTGAIGLLLNDEVDIAATELLMTIERMNVIDYTTPVYATKTRVYIKRPSTSEVKWSAYFAPFHANIWTAIGVLIVVTSATISILKNSSLAIFHDVKDTHHSPSRFTEIMLLVFGAFCSQGMQTTLLDPIRIVHLVIHLTAVIVLSAYSAALISSLAVQTFTMPFTTMEGLLKDGTYRFGAIRDSADYTFFQNTSDPILQVMFKQLLMVETDLPSNYFQGMQKICKDDKYSFMVVDNLMPILGPSLDCALEPLDAMLQATIGMAVQEDSPYRGIINSNLLMLRDSGLLQRSLSNVIKDSAKSSSSWISVEIFAIFPLILLLSGAMFLSIFMLSIEILVHRKLSKPLKMGSELIKKQTVGRKMLFQVKIKTDDMRM